MTEVLNNQNEERNPRPIGRFLLGLEDYKGEQDPFEYASEFASRPGNFAKFKHKSLNVGNTRDIMIDGRGMTLDFSISRYAYIWKIIIFAERHLTEHLSTNYTPHGGERYEIRCSVAKSQGSYTEYGVQGMAIKNREFDSAEQLQTLQGLIESIIDVGDTEPNQ